MPRWRAPGAQFPGPLACDGRLSFPGTGPSLDATSFPAGSPPSRGVSLSGSPGGSDLGRRSRRGAYLLGVSCKGQTIMKRTDGAPWWVGFVIVVLGGVVVVGAAFGAVLAGLCDMARDCTATNNVLTALAVVTGLIAFYGAPATAALATKRWWWATVTLPLPVAWLGHALAGPPAVASIDRLAVVVTGLSVLEVLGVVGLLAWTRRRPMHGPGNGF